jgi:hypothetical protein
MKWFMEEGDCIEKEEEPMLYVSNYDAAGYGSILRQEFEPKPL